MWMMGSNMGTRQYVTITVEVIDDGPTCTGRCAHCIDHGARGARCAMDGALEIAHQARVTCPVCCAVDAADHDTADLPTPRGRRAIDVLARGFRHASHWAVSLTRSVMDRIFPLTSIRRPNQWHEI